MERKFAAPRKGLRNLWNQLPPRSQKKQGGFPSSPSRSQSSCVPFQRSSSFTSWRYRQPFYSRSIADLPSKPGSFFACGKFGHWRAQCSLVRTSTASKSRSDSWLCPDDERPSQERAFVLEGQFEKFKWCFILVYPIRSFQDCLLRRFFHGMCCLHLKFFLTFSQELVCNWVAKVFYLEGISYG